MIHSIEQLCGLIQEKGRTPDTYSSDDEQAENIIHNLQVILESAQRQVDTVRQMHDILSSEANHETHNAELIRGMRRFIKAFGQKEPRINQGGKPTLIILFRGRVS
jgi:hypothetical protein